MADKVVNVASTGVRAIEHSAQIAELVLGIDAEPVEKLRASVRFFCFQRRGGGVPFYLVTSVSSGVDSGVAGSRA